MSSSEESYSGKVAVGAAMMVATRFSVRLLGLVSVTILARLLTPEDFGIFGTAALVLAFFFMVKEIGFGEAVIKTEDISRDDLDTLWTMRLILGSATAIALFVLVEPIAAFLKEPRVVDVLRLMAIIPIIDSLYSPASSLMLKEFKYKQDFILKSVDKFVRVIAVIILALTLKSYWALVFGSILASVFGVAISHVARPYLPRLTLVNRNKFGKFTLWLYFRSLARYVATSADEVVVRATENSAFFGIYHVARDLSRILITEIISPVGEALLPALVRFSGQTERFASATRDIVGIYFIVGIAVAFGIVATSNEIVLILLGSQWEHTATFLAIVAIGTACNSMGDINQSIFIAKNVPRYGAMFWTVRAASYFVLCLVAAMLWGPVGVVVAFSSVSILVLIAELVLVFRLVPSDRSWLVLILRPAIAGTLMLLGLDFTFAEVNLPLWALAIAKVALGSMVYVAALLGIWVLLGRNRGPEYSLIARLPSKVQSILLP
ncbi:MAG: oligosaccharide flippase family protein [Kordiimonas sp.]